MQKKIYGHYSLIGMVIIMVAILARIFGDSTKNNIREENSQQKYFAIVPHFTLQPKTGETFYRLLQTTYNIAKKEPINIVLISPDHFNANKNPIEMLCEESKSFCYK
ncbi:MAG: hypothetical protein WCH65_08040 [bacterium]